MTLFPLPTIFTEPELPASLSSAEDSENTLTPDDVPSVLTEELPVDVILIFPASCFIVNAAPPAILAENDFISALRLADADFFMSRFRQLPLNSRLLIMDEPSMTIHTESSEKRGAALSTTTLS